MTKKQQQPSELETLAKRVEELTAGWQRTQADFENFRRRTAQEREQLERLTAARTLLEITPALDNLRRALDHASDESGSLIEGIRHIERQLGDVLTRHGIERIPTIGEAFNPMLHEAIGQQEGGEAPDTIIQEIEAGYRTSDTILKPAKVIVSAGPAAAESAKKES